MSHGAKSKVQIWKRRDGRSFARWKGNLKIWKVLMRLKCVSKKNKFHYRAPIVLESKAASMVKNFDSSIKQIRLKRETRRKQSSYFCFHSFRMKLVAPNEIMRHHGYEKFRLQCILVSIPLHSASICWIGFWQRWRFVRTETDRWRSVTTVFSLSFQVRPKFLECLAVGCLYIAAKCKEEDDTIPITPEFVIDCNSSCSTNELLRMERLILEKFNWFADFVTPIDFLQTVTLSLDSIEAFDWAVSF